MKFTEFERKMIEKWTPHLEYIKNIDKPNIGKILRPKKEFLSNDVTEGIFYNSEILITEIKNGKINGVRDCHCNINAFDKEYLKYYDIINKEESDQYHDDNNIDFFMLLERDNEGIDIKFIERIEE